MVEMTAGADNILDLINRNLHSKTEKCHCELCIYRTPVSNMETFWIKHLQNQTKTCLFVEIS